MDARKEGSAALAIRCVECGRPWLDAAEHWRMYLTDDEPPEAVSYCPVCAAREFGRD